MDRSCNIAAETEVCQEIAPTDAALAADTLLDQLWQQSEIVVQQSSDVIALFIETSNVVIDINYAPPHTTP